MNDFYFYGSKIAWLLLNPVNLLFFATFIGVVLLWTKHQLWGRRIVTFMIVVIGLIGVLPIDQWMMRPLEEAHAKPDLTQLDKVDGIMVLGGEFNTRISADRNELTTVSGTERINAFIHLMRLYPNARLAFSGGSGTLTPGVAEANLSKTYIENLGVDTSHVIFEGESRNTRENAIYMKKVMNPQPGENFILITSAYHMPRSLKEFNKLGWSPIPYPVGYRTAGKTSYMTGDIRLKVNNLITAMREWLATVRP